MKKNPFLMLNALLLTFISLTAAAAETGQAMPACALSSLADNKAMDLSQLKGKVTYVDFWASWCVPCAKSFPFMNEMHQQLKDQGLQIVAVNLDENLDDAKAFLAKYPAEFTVLADASTDKKCAKDYAVKAMPSSYIIDKNGTVHHVHLGFKAGEAQEIRQLVEKLLTEKSAG